MAIVLNIVAQNVSGSAVTFTELDVPQTQIAVGASYALSDTNATLDIIANEELYTHVDSDLILLTVSGQALTKAQSLAFLRLEFSINFDFGDATFSGLICMDGELTPPTITSNVNDYNPTGIATANILRLSTNATRQIRGIQAPISPCNQVLFIVNVGTNNISLRNNNGSASAANRMLIGGNKTLQPDEGITLIYDKTSQRWRSFGRNN